MERESFMSPEIAAILNESFIPIKVDRESRPEIDEVYMNYVTATTGSGGWPLNVFITPDLDPVFGGTYWPGPNSTSLPRLAAEETLTFTDVLEKVRDLWQNQRQRCLLSAKDISSQLKHFAEEGIHAEKASESEPLDLDLLDDALSHFKQRYDKVNGGFSNAPKFPTPPNLSFLLSLGGAGSATSFSFPKPIRSIVGDAACTEALKMVEHTLVAMSRGGVRDLIGHGFHRYSVTRDWSLPHFEKMLYDNGQLLSVYSAAFSVTHNPEILGVIYSLIEYLTSATSSIVAKSGGLYSSEDADSLPTRSTTSHEKREGAYYVFTHRELFNILADEKSVQVLTRHYNVQPDGNVDQKNDPHDEFLGQNVLKVTNTPSQLAKEFGLSEEEVIRILKTGRKLLSEFRDRERPRPDTDTKIVTSWNALALEGLVDAYVVLTNIDPAKAKTALDTAQRIATFIKQELYDASSNTLKRVWSLMPDGTGKKDSNEAFLDDYAFLIHALLSLYQTTFDVQYLQWADRLQGKPRYLAFLSPPFLSRLTTTIKAHKLSFLLPSPVRLNTAFLSSDSQGYYSTSSPQQPSPKFSNTTEAATEIPPTLPLRLKPGTDNTEPSPNSLTALNLLHLSSLLSDTTYHSLALSTLNAFAVEVIQHPFLFVGMLRAVVASQVGIRNVTVITSSSTDTTPDEIRTILKNHNITQDSRTLITVLNIPPSSSSSSSRTTTAVEAAARPSAAAPSYLQTRNPLLSNISPSATSASASASTPNPKILLCENGTCRELKEGEKLGDGVDSE